MVYKIWKLLNDAVHLRSVSEVAWTFNVDVSAEITAYKVERNL
jgi:hypothetical protein